MTRNNVSIVLLCIPFPLRPGAYTFVSTEEEEPTRLDTVAAIEPSQPETPQHGVQHNTIVDPPPIEALTAPQIQWPISVHPTRGAFEIPDSEFPSTPRRQRRNGLPVTAYCRRTCLFPATYESPETPD